jgi:hypothetical protein
MSRDVFFRLSGLPETQTFRFASDPVKLLYPFLKLFDFIFDFHKFLLADPSIQSR